MPEVRFHENQILFSEWRVSMSDPCCAPYTIEWVFLNLGMHVYTGNPCFSTRTTHLAPTSFIVMDGSSDFSGWRMNWFEGVACTFGPIIDPFTFVCAQFPQIIAIARICVPRAVRMTIDISGKATKGGISGSPGHPPYGGTYGGPFDCPVGQVPRDSIQLAGYSFILNTFNNNALPILQSDNFSDLICCDDNRLPYITVGSSIYGNEYPLEVCLGPGLNELVIDMTWLNAFHGPQDSYVDCKLTIVCDDACKPEPPEPPDPRCTEPCFWPNVVLPFPECCGEGPDGGPCEGVTCPAGTHACSPPACCCKDSDDPPPPPGPCENGTPCLPGESLCGPPACCCTEPCWSGESCAGTPIKFAVIAPSATYGSGDVVFSGGVCYLLTNAIPCPGGGSPAVKVSGCPSLFGESDNCPTCCNCGPDECLYSDKTKIVVDYEEVTIGIGRTWTKTTTGTLYIISCVIFKGPVDWTDVKDVPEFPNVGYDNSGEGIGDAALLTCLPDVLWDWAIQGVPRPDSMVLINSDDEDPNNYFPIGEIDYTCGGATYSGTYSPAVTELNPDPQILSITRTFSLTIEGNEGCKKNE